MCTANVFVIATVQFENYSIVTFANWILTKDNSVAEIAIAIANDVAMGFVRDDHTGTAELIDDTLPYRVEKTP